MTGFTKGFLKNVRLVFFNVLNNPNRGEGYLAGIYSPLCAYQLCYQNKLTIRVMELLI